MCAVPTRPKVIARCEVGPTIKPYFSEGAVVSPELAQVGEQHRKVLLLRQHSLARDASGRANLCGMHIQECIIDTPVIEAGADAMLPACIHKESRNVTFSVHPGRVGDTIVVFEVPAVSEG